MCILGFPVGWPDHRASGRRQAKTCLDIGRGPNRGPRRARAPARSGSPIARVLSNGSNCRTTRPWRRRVREGRRSPWFPRPAESQGFAPPAHGVPGRPESLAAFGSSAPAPCRSTEAPGICRAVAIRICRIRAGLSLGLICNMLTVADTKARQSWCRLGCL